MFRAVPVPKEFIDILGATHRLRDAQKSRKRTNELFWSWTRQHASSVIIRSLMIDAGITEGAHRTAKGLRHAFGVGAVTKGVPLNLVSRWMGHASIETTAIYANAVGEEEAAIAARMWG